MFFSVFKQSTGEDEEELLPLAIVTRLTFCVSGWAAEYFYEE